jgi:hypothetical protein
MIYQQRKKENLEKKSPKNFLDQFFSKLLDFVNSSRG